MNSRIRTITPAQIIRVVFDRNHEGGMRLEGSLASVGTLAPVIPLFPACSFRRPATRRAVRSPS